MATMEELTTAAQKSGVNLSGQPVTAATGTGIPAYKLENQQLTPAKQAAASRAAASLQTAAGDAANTIGANGVYDGTRAYQAQTLTPATSQADSINNYYDQYLEAQKQAQKLAYDSNVRGIEYQASKLPTQYKAQREALAVDAEIANKNFREAAAANGINVGAGSQVQLASNNEYLRNMTTLRQAEAQAMNDVEEARRQTMADYQNAVAEAIANGNLQRAQALYDEAVRVDESIVSTARAQAQENYNAWQSAYTIARAQKEDELNDYNQKLDKAETLAKYGDFSGYAALGYTQSQINAMRALWLQQMYGTGGGSGGGGRSGGGSSSSSKSSNTSSSANYSRTGSGTTNYNLFASTPSNTSVVGTGSAKTLLPSYGTGATLTIRNSKL